MKQSQEVVEKIRYISPEQCLKEERHSFAVWLRLGPVGCLNYTQNGILWFSITNANENEIMSRNCFFFFFCILRMAVTKKNDMLWLQCYILTL